MRKNLIIAIVGLLYITGCIDKKEFLESSGSQYEIKKSNELNYPEPRNFTINGADYQQSQAQVGKYGGVLISSTIGDGPKTFNPWESKDATSSSVGDLLYDGLATIDVNTGEVIPKLAKKIEVLPDNMTYKITLRRGVKWSDGNPITADDVIFTWKDIIFGGFGNTSTRDSLYIDGILPEVKKVNDYEIVFKTYKPFAPFIRTLSTPIAPKHIFEPIIQKGQSEFSAYMSGSSDPKVQHKGLFLNEIPIIIKLIETGTGSHI